MVIHKNNMIVFSLESFLLGLGIHFHALTHSVQWIDHWGMYTLIIGFAFLLRSQKQTKVW